MGSGGWKAHQKGWCRGTGCDSPAPCAEKVTARSERASSLLKYSPLEPHLTLTLFSFGLSGRSFVLLSEAGASETADCSGVWDDYFGK